MKITEITNTWDELVNKLKLKFETLTDDDLLFVKGEEQEMLRRVEYKLGKTTEEFSEIIKNL